VAFNELLAVEEFAKALWARYIIENSFGGWCIAEMQVHGAYMFRSFMGGNASYQYCCMLDDLAGLCGARAELARVVEIRPRVDAD